MAELSQIKDPADIRGLSREECEELAGHVRESEEDKLDQLRMYAETAP